MDFKKIKNYQAACKATGRNPEHLPDVSKLPERDREFVINNYKRMVVIEAINEMKNPDWSDWSQFKYAPYLKVEGASKENPNGSGLSYNGYDHTYTHTDVGSRLTYLSFDKMKHGVDNFMDLYEGEFLIKS